MFIRKQMSPHLTLILPVRLSARPKLPQLQPGCNSLQRCFGHGSQALAGEAPFSAFSHGNRPRERKCPRYPAAFIYARICYHRLKRPVYAESVHSSAKPCADPSKAVPRKRHRVRANSVPCQTKPSDQNSPPLLGLRFICLPGQRSALTSIGWANHSSRRSTGSARLRPRSRNGRHTKWATCRVLLCWIVNAPYLWQSACLLPC